MKLKQTLLFASFFVFGIACQNLYIYVKYNAYLKKINEQLMESANIVDDIYAFRACYYNGILFENKSEIKQ